MSATTAAPPVATNLFVAAAIFRQPFVEVAKSILPTLGIICGALVVIMYVPVISTGPLHAREGQPVYAGYAVGMTYAQTMQLVVLPQAFRNMLPVLMTQTIILFQDTSLVYAIGAYDLLKGFEIAGKNFNRPVETYLVAAVVYFVICFSLSMLVRRLQKKISIIR